MNTASLEITIRDSGLDATAADSLKLAFNPLFDAAKIWQTRVAGLVVTDISQVREMKLARESRLALKEIRCNAERKRKELKEESVRRGKAIDGVYNVLEYLITPIEEYLLGQEQFAIRKEDARLDAQMVERKSAITFYAPTALDDLTIRGMTDEAFSETLFGAKNASEARQAEAERAERERLAREKAESEERDRVRVENDRLRAEAAAREDQMRLEREAAAKATAEAKAAADKATAKARAEAAADKAKAEAKAEADKAKARAEAEAREDQMRLEQARLRAMADKSEMNAIAERNERQRIQREVDDKVKAEADEKRRLANAPDRERLGDFLEKLCALDLPEMSSDEGQAAKTALAHSKRHFENLIKTAYKNL